MRHLFRIAQRTALSAAVILLTAQSVFAQITLNLDVLTDDFIDKGTVSTAPEKKPAPPKKPVVKPVQKPKPVKKYTVQESKIQDEHDKLKPRAKPVPEVKVVSMDRKVPQKETNKPKTVTIKDGDSVIVLKEPPLSKLYIEQEKNKAIQAEQTAEIKKAPEKPKEAVKKVEPAPKTLLSQKQNKTDDEEKTPQAKTKPAPKKFSVFPVAKNLSTRKRSEALLKEIPLDAPTKAAAESKGMDLAHLFIFEESSAELTKDMQAALQELANELKKSPKKRILLYTYAGSTAPDYGRERQVSLRRALMIRSYLSRAGIRSLRVEIRSQGENGAGIVLPNRADILVFER